MTDSWTTPVTEPAHRAETPADPYATPSTDPYGTPSTDPYGSTPSVTPSTPPSATDTTDTSEDAGRADVAKEQASQVAGGAKDAGAQVAGEAKAQAAEVGKEARTQAKDLLHQTRGELTTQAGQQQQRVAGGLRSIGAELGQMAGASDEPGPASDLAGQVGERVESIASWLEDREPGQVLSEVQDFARQRPVAFLALAAGAGLLVGRLARGVKDASSDDTPSHGTGSTPSAPTTEPVVDVRATSGSTTTGAPFVSPTPVLADPVEPGFPASAPGGYSTDGRLG